MSRCEITPDCVRDALMMKKAAVPSDALQPPGDAMADAIG
jgi:hypothetical protein